jgi:hypothetical protein
MMDKPIADVFAECLEAIESRGATIEQCLARYPAHRDELQELFSTFQMIQDTPATSPSPAFKQNARIRLENLLPDRPKPVTFLRSIRRNKRIGNQSYQRRFSMNWLLIVALLASLFAGGSGVAYAAQDALPGDALYGVKNAVQTVQLTLSGDEGDVDLLLGFMREHIEEIEALTEMGHFQWIGLSLDEYNQELEQLMQTRTRINYEDAHAEEALTSRIQTQIAAQLEYLLQLQTRLQDQTQLQDKLQQTIRAAENGAGYGPGVGGPNEEPGNPNGAGPGEPQGEQQQYQTQSGNPEDTGNTRPGDGNGYQNTGESGPHLGAACDPFLAGEVIEGQNEDGTGNGVYWTCMNGTWQYYQGQGGNGDGQGSGQGQGQGGKP